MLIKERKGNEGTNINKDICCIQFNVLDAFPIEKTELRQIHRFFWRKHNLLRGNYCNFLLDNAYEKHLFLIVLGGLVS